MNTLQERLRANPLPLPNVMELCREAADRIDALEAENFALAAGQCAEVVGDEGGTPRCKRISELERQRYALRTENADLRATLETERMRLVACGVVASADTPESAATARDMHPDYRSAALDDVIRRVDECITLRATLKQAREALAESAEAIENAAHGDGINFFAYAKDARAALAAIDKVQP